MNIINITKEERLLINKAILKVIGDNPGIKRISDTELMGIVLNEFIKGEKYGNEPEHYPKRTAKK